MATVDELERLDRDIRLAENRATLNLAGHLRDAVRDMPSEPRLALEFARTATSLELMATGRNCGSWTASRLRDLVGAAMWADPRRFKEIVRATYGDA